MSMSTTMKAIHEAIAQAYHDRSSILLPHLPNVVVHGDGAPGRHLRRQRPCSSVDGSLPTHPLAGTRCTFELVLL